ncbi:acyl carrier protein [Lentzea sp. NPDC054927]
MQTGSNAVARSELRALLEDLLRTQGKPLPVTDDHTLADLGFSSLDLAELTVRLEDRAGGELALEAAEIRPLATVGDLLDLLGKLTPVAG